MSALYRSVALVLLLMFIIPYTYAQNCTINAGVTTSVCPNQPFQLVGSSSGLIAAGSIPVWTQVGGPAVTITNPNSLSTPVTGYAPGNTYKFRLSAKCVDGSLIYDEVTYNTKAATIADAGPDFAVCPPGATLAANTPGAGETGQWSVIGSSTGISYLPANVNKPAMPITASSTASGTVTLRWTISSSACMSSDDVVVTAGGGVMPVTAGPNQSLSNCYTTTQTATMAASYGGNNTNGQQGTWSFISGPSVPAITNINSNTTTVTKLIAGIYRFRWTVSGPCANGAAEMTITVPAATQSVTGATNATATFCDNRTSTLITGIAPSYSNEVLTWSRVSGTGNITAPNSPSTTITGLTGVKSVFSYSIVNSVTGCASNGTYTINYTTPPTITAASPLIIPCDITTATINYSTTGGDQTQWSLISAPAGSALGGATGTTAYANAGSPLSLTGLTVPGTYLVRIKRTTNGGSGGCQDAYTDVNIQVSKSPTASNAGTRQTLACSVYNTELIGNTPTSGTGSWSQVSGPNMANIADKNAPKTAITGLTNGVYTFRWIITGNVGCPNQQSDVQVVVSSRTPTVAAAGPDVTICNNSPYHLQGNVPALNETGTWTVTPAAGVTFSNVNDPAAVVSGLAPSTAYTFTWTIKNMCGQGSADVHIVTSATAGPKQAIAGGSQCLSAGTTVFTLAGNTPSGGETGLWTLVSGPNTPTFTNKNNYNTPVTFAVDGTYRLEWSLARNGCAVSRDTTTVTISLPTSTSQAGTDQKLCGGNVLTLAASAPATGVGAWTQTQGPGGVIISNPNQPNTTVTNVSDGRYTFRWTVSNGACLSNYKEVNYTLSTPPTIADAGPDQSLCGTTATTLAANTVTNGVGTWSIVSGPSNPTFANPGNPATAISNLKAGNYLLRWSVSGSTDCPVSTSDVHITVTENAKVKVASQSLCNATSAEISGNEGSSGTWLQTAGPSSAIITNTSGSTAIVSNLLPGTYKFTYTLPAAGSCSATSDVATVIISAPPSTADAGLDENLCLTASSVGTVFHAVAPPAGTGAWTVTTKPTGSPNPVINTPGAANSSVSNLVSGIYIFNWKVTNGSCSSSDVMRITVYDNPTTAAAGATQPDGCNSNIILSGNTPVFGIGKWTVVSGPNVPVIDAENSPQTNVQNTIIGPYVFRWTISNGSCTDKTSDVNVTVTSTPPTVANANVGNVTPKQVCNTTGTGVSVNLNANPVASGETGKWSILSPVGSTAVFTTPSSPTTDITGLTAGTYKLQWAINSGSCQSTDTLSITVYDLPTVATTGGAQSICLYSPLTLNGNAPASGTGVWSLTAGPSTPVFSNKAAANASVTGLQNGAYNFRWTISNGVCPQSVADMQAIVEDCRIQVVKTAGTPVLNADGSYNVTFKFTVTNPGANITISNVQVTDNLRTALPLPKTFSVVSLSAGGVLAAATNTSFNGTTDQNLLNASAASLAPGESAVVTLVVKVNLN